MKKALKILAASAIALTATPALAHFGPHADGLAGGLLHPLTGIDHLLAMLAVGLWSATAMEKKLWAGPATFVGMMLVGAALAMTGFGLPAVEGIIAVSILVLGLFVVSGSRLPTSAGLGVIGFFALFHGHAHASEAIGSIGTYILGFTITSVAIHLAGIATGRYLTRYAPLRHLAGLAIAGTGIAVLLGQ